MKEYQKGTQAISKGKHKEAIQSFDKILAINPEHKKAHYYKALANYHLENYEAAWKGFRGIQPLDGDDYKAIYFGGLSALALRKADTAILYLESLIPEQEDIFSDFFYNIAKAYSTAEQHEKAIEYGTLYFQENPQNKDVLLLLHDIHVAAKQWLPAVQYINKLIYQDKENEALILKRAYCNIQLDAFEQGFKDANFVKSQNPENGEAIYLLGKIREENRDFTTAVKHYRHASTKYEDDRIYAGLGKCHLFLGNPDSSIYFYDIAVKRADNYDNNIGYAMSLQNDNKQSEAIRIYNKILKRTPEDSVALNNRASCKAAINSVTGAMNDYKEAIRVAPKFEEPYINLAILYGKERRHTDALALIEKVLEFKPKSSLANYLLALNNEALGKGNCADFQRAFDLGIKEAKSRIEKYCN